MQLTRVSSRDIELSLRRLRASPGVTSATLSRKRRRPPPSERSEPAEAAAALARQQPSDGASG